mmetsp:Transcript_24570/g.36056  ORF Transcript_24570/g.36056 Transcript_24570/m.36056 type:complete len:203 (-) Transcript_24570:264-872(-)
MDSLASAPCSRLFVLPVGAAWRVRRFAGRTGAACGCWLCCDLPKLMHMKRKINSAYNRTTPTAVGMILAFNVPPVMRQDDSVPLWIKAKVPFAPYFKLVSYRSSIKLGPHKLEFARTGTATTARMLERINRRGYRARTKKQTSALCFVYQLDELFTKKPTTAIRISATRGAVQEIGASSSPTFAIFRAAKKAFPNSSSCSEE